MPLQHEEYVALTHFIKIVCLDIVTNPGLMISFNKEDFLVAVI